FRSVVAALERLRQPRVEPPALQVVRRRVVVSGYGAVDRGWVAIEHVVDTDGQRRGAPRAAQRVAGVQVEPVPIADLARRKPGVAVVLLALVERADVAHV